MKSFLAVLAGLAFTVVVAVVLDVVMHVTGVYSEEISDMTTSDWLLALSYRLLSAIGAGWITARLAPSRPMFFAVLLGVDWYGDRAAGTDRCLGKKPGTGGQSGIHFCWW